MIKNLINQDERGQENDLGEIEIKIVNEGINHQIIQNKQNHLILKNKQNHHLIKINLNKVKRL